MNSLRDAVAVLIALSVLATPAFAEQVSVRRFMAGTPDGRIIEGGRATYDSTQGRLVGTSRDGGRVELDVNELSYLSISRGSRAATAAGLGALAGGLLSLSAILQVSADPDAELNQDAVAPLTLGFMAVGALIGGFVGSNQDRWESVEMPRGVAAPPVPGTTTVFAISTRF